MPLFPAGLSKLAATIFAAGSIGAASITAVMPPAVTSHTQQAQAIKQGLAERKLRGEHQRYELSRETQNTGRRQPTTSIPRPPEQRAGSLPGRLWRIIPKPRPRLRLR